MCRGYRGYGVHGKGSRNWILRDFPKPNPRQALIVVF